MVLFPLPWILAEILIFTTWTHFYEFWDVFLLYWAPSAIGALLLAVSGQSLMLTLRTQMTPGQPPGPKLMRQGARLAGAICLLIPLFLPRVLAIFLIVPGLQQLSILVFRKYLFQRFARSNAFSFVHFGGGPTPGAGPWAKQGFGQAGPFREEKDARVVDITPLEITHSPLKKEPKE